MEFVSLTKPVNMYSTGQKATKNNIPLYVSGSMQRLNISTSRPLLYFLFAFLTAAQGVYRVG